MYACVTNDESGQGTYAGRKENSRSLPCSSVLSESAHQSRRVQEQSCASLVNQSFATVTQRPALCFRVVKRDSIKKKRENKEKRRDREREREREREGEGEGKREREREERKRHRAKGVGGR